MSRVLGLLLFDQLKDRRQAQDLMAECVQAILGGAIAKEISVIHGYGNPEETFVCAMMHNLGRMLSVYYFPEETAEIRRIVAHARGARGAESAGSAIAPYSSKRQAQLRAADFP